MRSMERAIKKVWCVQGVSNGKINHYSSVNRVNIAKGFTSRVKAEEAMLEAIKNGYHDLTIESIPK